MATYFQQHFVAAYQQVGSFEVTDQHGKLQRNGGNVASYFCTPEGRVIHAVTGPVAADELLDEARWAVAAYDQTGRNRDAASAARLADEHRLASSDSGGRGHTSKSQAIHQLLHENHAQLLKNAYFEMLHDQAKIRNYFAEQILKEGAQ